MNESTVSTSILAQRGVLLVEPPSRLARVGEGPRPTVIHGPDPSGAGALCGAEDGLTKYVEGKDHERILGPEGQRVQCEGCLRELERRRRPDGGAPQVGVGTPKVQTFDVRDGRPVWTFFGGHIQWYGDPDYRLSLSREATVIAAIFGVGVGAAIGGVIGA